MWEIFSTAVNEESVGIKKRTIVGAAAALALIVIAIFVVLVFRRELGTNADSPVSRTVVAEEQKDTGGEPAGQGNSKEHGHPRKVVASTSLSPVPSYRSKSLDFTGFRARYLDLLAKATGGDADAALELSTGLKACSGVPRNGAAIQDQKKQIAANYVQGSQAYDDATQFMNTKIEGCSAFSDAELSSSTKWLAQAAAAGNPEAKLAYIDNARPADANSPNFWQDTRDFEDTAKRYLNDELNAGNPKALFSASMNYAQGGLFDPDASKELAYLYAYSLATNTTSGPIFDRLQTLSNAIPPSLRPPAMREGETLYQQCCVNQ
jgi:hypothetical protein